MAVFSRFCVSAVKHRIHTGSWKGAGTVALHGAADGYMWGGIEAFAGSSIKAGTKSLQLSGQVIMEKYL